MSDVLSQDEIDQLLTAIHGGDEDSENEDYENNTPIDDIEDPKILKRILRKKTRKIQALEDQSDAMLEQINNLKSYIERLKIDSLFDN